MVGQAKRFELTRDSMQALVVCVESPSVGTSMKRRNQNSRSQRDELDEWERQALKFDFSGMPIPFCWEQSARFSHFINGYEIAGGMDRLTHLYFNAREIAYATGRWPGGVTDLWLCLFYEHRIARHTGSEPEGEELSLANQLCEQLRAALLTYDVSQLPALRRERAAELFSMPEKTSFSA